MSFGLDFSPDCGMSTATSIPNFVESGSKCAQFSDTNEEHYIKPFNHDCLEVSMLRSSLQWQEHTHRSTLIACAVLQAPLDQIGLRDTLQSLLALRSKGKTEVIGARKIALFQTAMANNILEMVQLLKDGNQHEEALVGDIPADYTIFEVQAHLRELSPTRYQSKVLELGLHRRTLQKSQTEVFKFQLIRIVHSKLTKIHSSWDRFASDVVGDVNKARRAYSTSSDRFTDEEVQSLLASDALFLVVLFKYVNGQEFFWREFEAVVEHLREILAKMEKSDFFLIENQVPMYLLQSATRGLCEINEETQARIARSDPTFKIEEMVEDELEKVLNEAVLHLSPFTFPDIAKNRIPQAVENSRGRLYKHLLNEYPVVPLERSLITCRHLLDCLYIVICGHSLPLNVELGVGSNLALENIPSATRLSAGGIRTVGTVSTVSDIRLSGTGYARCAKLQLPKVELYDYSELAFHNLALHEQKTSEGLCGDFRCYLQCMASLCVSMSDVQLLSELGVINNHMGHDCISGMWDRTLRGVLTPNPSSKWVECYRRIHQHRKAYLKRWRRECWTLFFSRPWTLVKVVGAIMLLFLTAVQTWLTAFPPKGSNKGKND